METEMGEFINKEIQESPWPEDHDTRINQRISFSRLFSTKNK